MPNSQSSTTACGECRKQKLKCSRDLPVCKRCTKHNIDCHFPSPPDRKAIAKSRAPWGAKKQCFKSVETSPSLRLMSPTILSHFNDADPMSLPSIPLGLHLLETFFSHYISATVIFNKSKVINEYLESKLPEHATQAMFALASIFLEETTQIRSHEARSETAQVLTSQAKDWARLASQHCLLEAHRPSLEIIQSNEILSTYWFAKGDVQRAKLHSHAAYLAARGLGYQSLKPERRGSESVSSSLVRLLGSRCFWNCWVITFIILGDDLFTVFPSEFALTASNMSLDTQIHGYGIAKRAESHEHGKFLDSLQLLHIYHDIQILQRNGLQPELDQLVGLQRRLKFFWDDFPEFRYSGSYQELSQPDMIQDFFIQSIYNLSMMSLHSFFIPLFTGKSTHASLSAKLLHNCTKTTIHHADTFVDMIHAAISACQKTLHLPPFTGYCSFVVASIYASLLNIQDASISKHARSQLISCLVILDDLQKHWIPLKRLWERISQSVKDEITAYDITERRRALYNRCHEGMVTLDTSTDISISDIMQPSHAVHGLYQFPYISHQAGTECEVTMQTHGDIFKEEAPLESQERGALLDDSGWIENQSQMFMDNDRAILFENNSDEGMLTIDPNLVSIGSNV